jgi:HEAT repeat protein
MDNHARFLSQVNAKNCELLYRCRWSKDDAARVIPKLIDVLSSADRRQVDESLRALFLIGTPAFPAAQHVVPHCASKHSITRRLAVLTLGQIAHQHARVCLEPLIDALDDAECRSDAIRILAYLKGRAKPALAALARLFDSKDAKTRTALVKAVAAIDRRSKQSQALFKRAKSDRSKTVRLAAEMALQPKKA